MSDSPSLLPDRPSLEQLRRQAKDRLKALRAAGGTATLADVHFALAREYGFENWAALVHHVESINPLGIRKFEAIAEQLADAYSTGDLELLREIGWTWGIHFTADFHGDIDAMQRRLPNWFASADRPRDLAIADARHLVARKLGFDGWTALVSGLAAPKSPAVAGKDLPFCSFDEHGRMSIEGPAADTRWDDVVALMRERHVTAVMVTGISDRGLKTLAGLSQITSLAIAGAQLTDEGMPHLARMPQLEALGVGGPKARITDRGLEALRHLPNLRKVHMGWTPGITDAGAAHLAGCERLEEVDLMGTPTGNGALWALSGKGNLRKLQTGRLVTDKGLEVLQLFPRFKRWHGGTLQYDLMSFDSEPTNLLLDGPFTDVGLTHLSGLDGLVGLNLFWHTPNFTSSGLESLAGLPKLAFLGCDGKRCDDTAMRAIAGIPKLRMLMAQGTVASDAGFEALSASPTLEYLWGRACPGLTGRGFRALTSMPAIRGLAVSCARVDDAALATLAGCPTLDSLLPMDVTDEGFRHVGRCAQLEHLWCMYCRDTTDAATEHLTGLSHLRYYYAGMTKITDRSLGILARLTTLERLEFWEIAAITDAGLAALATLPRLREVSIGGSPRVTRAGVAQFGPGVRVKYEP